MPRKFTIHLRDLAFRAYHGWYPEEQVVGNDFLVNIHLDLISNMPVVKDLQDTVDYANVYALVEKQMSVATPLLETLVEEIADQIHELDKRIERVHITIDKLNPPIKGMKGRVAVQLEKNYGY